MEGPQAEEAVIGIDFGTTGIRTAVYKRIGRGNEAEMLDTEKETPALVAFSSGGIVELVGAATNKPNQDSDIRRILGRRYEDFCTDTANHHHYWPFKLAYACGVTGRIGIVCPSGAGTGQTTEKLCPVDDVATALISHALTKATRQLKGGRIASVGITIPNSYNQAQRKELRDVVRRASGAEECHLITETLATALAHTSMITRRPPTTAAAAQDTTMMVVHFGAGSFDASVIRVEKTHLRVLGSAGDANLGGRDIDNRLLRYAERQIRGAYKVDCSASSPKKPLQRQALLEICERLKVELCSNMDVDGNAESTLEADIEAVIGVENAKLEISNATFRAICKGLVTEATNIAKVAGAVQEAIRASQLNPNTIDLLLITGRASQIPTLCSSLSELFPAEKKPRVVYLHHNGNALAARGAAIYAACCQACGGDEGENGHELRKWTVTEAVPSAMGIILGRVQRQVVAENFTYPITKSVRLRRTPDIVIGQIYEADKSSSRQSTRQHITLGEFPIDVGNDSVSDDDHAGICELLFKVDTSGILHVLRSIDIYYGLERIFTCPICYSDGNRAEAITCYGKRHYIDVLDASANTAANNSSQVHFFCVECVQNLARSATTDTPLSAGGIGLQCMEHGCQQPILFASCHSVLDARVLERLYERGFEENLAVTGLKNLERCSNCNFLIEMDIPKEVERRFLCLKCQFSNCRLCEREWTEAHEELTCEEMDEREQQEVHDREARRIEARMNEAIIRKCPNCRLVFVKADGCNKMTCPCGRTMCYLCRTNNVRYDHFNDLNCPLYGDAEPQDAAALKQIVNEAAAAGVRVTE